MQDYHQVGRDHWKRRSDAWVATAPTGLSTDDTLNQLIIQNLNIKAGENVLDLGSGTGDPAITIGLSLDEAGTITACDLTPEMLVTARSRANHIGLSVVRFVAADMKDLAFADNSFDCVTCRFGLMFPEDKVRAAKEVRRVLKPGGRVGYMVWGPYNENPSFFVIRRAIAQALGNVEGPPPHRHNLGAPGLLLNILNAAAFDGVEEREVHYKRPVEDLGSYIKRALARGYSDMIDRMTNTELDTLIDKIHVAFEPYREKGKVFMPNSTRLGIGWKTY
mgnify:FL=1